MESRIKESIIKHLEYQKSIAKDPEGPFICCPMPGKNSWTISEIIEEVRKETEFGEEFADDVIGYFMSKESINEWINSQELTTEDLDFMWDFCIVFGHPVISKLGMASWKDLRPDLIKQIPNEYEKMVEKVIYNNKE